MKKNNNYWLQLFKNLGYKYILLLKCHIFNVIYLFSKDHYPNKIFCIGMNKTGTTSIEKTFKDLGYVVGNQAEAEILALFTEKAKYSFLINYCKTAEAYQDVPFSRRKVYKVLDKKFPKAKFILTVRDDVNEWYESLIRFHKNRLSKDGNPIRVRDIKKSAYRYKGWQYDMAKLLWLKGRKYSDDDFVYIESFCKEYYNKHNAEAIDYFRGRDNFLVINLKEKDSYYKLCKFLDKKPLYNTFPHKNRSR